MPPWTIIYVACFWVLLALLLAASLRWGDAAARWACSIVGVAMVAQKTARWFIEAPYRTVSIPALVIDLTLLILLGTMAVRYQRWWLIALASVQLVTCLGHLSKMWNPQITRLTYAIFIGTGGYPVLILLSMGLISSIRSRSTPKRRPV